MKAEDVAKKAAQTFLNEHLDFLRAPDRKWCESVGIDVCQIAVQTLREAGLLLEPQPIETAPKDGTEVIGYNDQYGPTIVFYGSMELLSLTQTEIESFDEDDFFAETWWCFAQDGASRIACDLVPTAWLPLPKGGEQ